MSAVIQVVGIPKLMAAMQTKRKQIERALARGVTKGALLIQKDARTRIMKGPKTGRMYAGHRASAPGQAPANDTGNLQRSISVVAAAPSDRVTAQVTAAAEYASPLESGTLDGRIEPRPFMTPSAVENAKAVGELVRDEIERAINS